MILSNIRQSDKIIAGTQKLIFILGLSIIKISSINNNYPYDLWL